jgi:hypothetical protein
MIIQKRPLRKQSRQAEYDRLTALPVWARTFGEIIRCRIDSACTGRRNETRSLSLMSAPRVNCGPVSKIVGAIEGPLRIPKRPWRQILAVYGCDEVRQACQRLFQKLSISCWAAQEDQQSGDQMLHRGYPSAKCLLKRWNVFTNGGDSSVTTMLSEFQSRWSRSQPVSLIG